MIIRFVLFLAALIGSCSDPTPATEVLVVVDSDLAVGSALTNLRVRVYDRAGKTQVAVTDFALSPQRGTTTFPLPLSYSLVPSEGVQQFRLVVTGQGPRAGAPQVDIVERQAIASFGEGKRLLLPIYLDGRCLNKLCRNGDEPEDQTCSVGMCVGVQEEPLAPAGSGPTGDYDAAVFKPQVEDAGTDAQIDGSADAGQDAGSDAGPDAGADAETDAGPDAATDAGPDAATDAGPPPCGTWVASSIVEAPPANGTPYGVEYNNTGSGTFNQYVCRVKVAETYLPGKGVYGYSCYYIDLNNEVAFSDTFEVLVNTASCARMLPVRQANRAWLLPTGSDADGPLYSCANSRPSDLTAPPPERAISHPLGRYDPANDRCVYEWYGQTQFSSLDGLGQPTYSVLTR
ncbi:MAG TPA: hypothetical protein VFX59_10730 [Polyangiales bacterium]|nr:hypothetical protein [Polyangiales bacterium]